MNQPTDVGVRPWTTSRNDVLTRYDVGQVVSIDMLPDDVLLEIFDFFTKSVENFIQEWQILVHVCRRW
jgi:hypothetical protein